MKRLTIHLPSLPFLLAFLLPASPLLAEPPSDPAAMLSHPPAAQQPKATRLDDGQYAIGAIHVDQKQGELQVPGKVIRIKPPLEFLAVTQGGLKAYESMLELESDAFEFNLACIMLGLDAKGAQGAEHHFDPRLIEGAPVKIWVSWQRDGKIIRLPAARILGGKGAKSASEEWVYTGSSFSPKGKYMAAMDGALIGFVHDPASIIEHKQGLGLGDYGAIGDENNTIAPPVGTAITLIVKRVR